MPNKKRAKWTEEQLVDAMNAVRNGMPPYRAANMYNIPRRTLRNHLESGSIKKKLGRHPILSEGQERELVRRIVRLCDVGMPLTPKILRKSVYEFANENNIRHNFSNLKKIAGKKWLKCFYSRHPDIAKRRAQKLNLARAQKINREVVDDYFKKLRTTLIEKNFQGKPSQIYNMDEKGCQLTLHHQQTVLAQKGAKRVHLVAPEHGENVSVAACANALGQCIPPLIIFKGVRIKPEWYITLPEESKILMTKRGSMTTNAFIKWLEHFSKFKSPGPVLLIFDGASSHLDIRIVEAAEQYEITLFCLPSNSTHELQPLDKAVFRSFESFWDEEVLNFWVNHPNERTITRARFGEIFTPVWLKSMSAENILSGFRATGIWPFNPNAIPEAAFAPSVLTHRALPDNVLEKDVGKNSQIITEPVAGPSGFSKVKKPKLLESDSDSSGSYTSDSSSDEIEEEFADLETLTDDDRAEEEKQESDLQSNEVHNVNIESSAENNGAKEEKINKSPNKSGNKEKKCKDLDVSFAESGFFTTPELKVSIKKRRPAINSKAQEVTRDLFSAAMKKGNEDKKKKVTMKKDLADKKEKNISKEKKQVSKKKESWFCFVCNEERIADMRICNMCGTYVHEECVGLRKEDKEVFFCPRCS